MQVPVPSSTTFVPPSSDRPGQEASCRNGMSADAVPAMAAILHEIESQHGLTPVLVSGPRLVLADDFYAALCRELIAISGRPVRLDLLAGHLLSLTSPERSPRLPSTRRVWLPAVAASAIFPAMRKRIIRRLARKLPPQAGIEFTLSVARPGGRLRELVVGLAGPSDELPVYAREIAVGIDLSGAAA